jgi:hypothetical protein
MKPIISLALCLLSTAVFAQLPLPQPPPRIPQVIGRPGNQPANNGPSEMLPENYVLKIVVSDKDHPVGEFSMVVLKRNFRFSTFDPVLTMNGDISVEDQGTVICQYSINASVAVPNAPSGSNGPAPGGNSFEYRQTEAQSCARLRLGEPTQILKSGGRTYELTISRQTEAAKKAK